jgi:uncharacterized membrane protein YbhN (UPF0104 family)
LKRRIISAAKTVWVGIVFVGAAWYLVTHRDTIAGELRTVALWRLVASAGLLAGGKLCLVQLSRQSVWLVGGDIAYLRMFQINAMSQLAKYLPGGVWHLLGRAGYYYSDKLSAAQASWAIIAENAWLVSSAFFFGLGTLAFYVLVGQPVRATIVAGGLVLLDALVIVVLFRVRHARLSWRTAGTIVLLQTTTWLLIGASLWVLLPQQQGMQLLLLTVSAFALSWFVGYISILAPSGLGIRELVLTALFGMVMPLEQALVYATVNRVIWILSELALASISMGINWRQTVESEQPS